MSLWHGPLLNPYRDRLGVSRNTCLGMKYSTVLNTSGITIKCTEENTGTGLLNYP